MTLTEQQLKIISERPLTNILHQYRDKLRNFDECDQASQDEIANFLSSLVGSPAAFSLPSPDGSGNVAVKLFSIQQQVQGGGLKLEQFRPLVSSVVANSPDLDVWNTIFKIIETLSPLTPPPSSIAPTFKGTPVKTSSSRLADSETRDIVEGELFEEIKNCTFRNVKGFCDKFFDPKFWRQEQKAMLRAIMTAHDGKIWTEFPPTPDEKLVWDWLWSLEERFLAGAPHRLHTTRTANQFKERKGQMDVFLQTPVTNANDTFKHKHVLVVGEQKKSNDTGRFKATLLQLARYVRGVFADQPTRRFVHAFSLCASTMELWVFDRSGPYSSGPFDIHDEPDKFARALVGYATMDDDAMGLDTFIKRGDACRHVILDDASGNAMTVRLDKAMVRQRAIVCRGTTCYEAQNSQVAKFSWASDKRKLESEQLRLAEQRGVKGVARVVAHRQIITIAELRDGLEFPKHHKFRSEANFLEDLPSATTSAHTPDHKRKSSDDDASDKMSGSKKRRPNSQKSKLSTEFNDQLSIGKAKPSLYKTGEDPWENRIYSCLLVSPAGRVISDFRTIKELLESMRDAIRAHQSLYTVGNILHRDISSNNIIITNPKTADGFRGMLIDLDLAKVRDGGPSGARHQTGTMQFMAIQVLRGVDHTYRHDLESFFYVLLWMCARCSWSIRFSGEGKPPRESLLRKWEVGSFSDIADAKEGHMTVNGLERIMNEFPDVFHIVKPLCLRIRRILFPLDKDERMNIGTPVGTPDQLYNDTIVTYDEAIAKL
ncbi:serine/threonine-protein kinase Sgk2 [Metarhizium album ARSEF 1941]|uniref:EKC/KEOPS complex subunit BUD32 n=1 Tax=Metarhizium album (strain ARSEF 1941) TaxID=1081103 RepID=A0A0B2WH50_METAS|nr:serine/threonine-protein kinase Sgk2 [Metarhizium album ARSEF 1941]KHN95316.1 serine/threonine-protein kinase Sgk2 [Metarhizium album ARSEF 1941]